MVSDGDYSSLSMLLTFVPGSANGTQLCANVIAPTDNLVESEEHFRIFLVMETPALGSLHLENSETSITLIDSDGK